ncbi:MAG: hypothetical protein WB984_06625 [Thermoplasmata archaeon]
MRRFPTVPGSHFIDAVMVVVCVAFVVAGFVFYGACNGGDSLILFGVATAVLGALLYRTGAWATVIPFAIITVTLIGGGWYGATVAGCSL